MNKTSVRGTRVAQSNTSDLRSILKDLISDGLIAQSDAAEIVTTQRNRNEALLHPLEIVAAKQLICGPDKKPLSLELLSEWLAKKACLQLAHIDPLKINVPAITSIMSFAYAQRYGILCLKVSRDELVIATMQPFDRSWVESLEQTSRRTIQTQVANPAEIKKYTLEFYSLAKSVFGAGSATDSGTGIANFEQLLEVGKLKDADAQDQHIVNIVDWLLQYAFEQRASVFISNRGAARARCALESTAYCIWFMNCQTIS